MPSIVMLLAPGLLATPERFAAAVVLAQITMPYLPMISLVAFWAALANAHDRFVPGAAMPIIFNLCMIAGALVVPLVSGELGLERAIPVAFGLLGAGVLQIAIMYVVLPHGENAEICTRGQTLAQNRGECGKNSCRPL